MKLNPVIPPNKITPEQLARRLMKSENTNLGKVKQIKKNGNPSKK